MQTELVTMTEIASDYMRKAGYSIFWLDKVERDEQKNQWRLVFSVGISKELKKTVVLDDETQKVIAFE